MNSIKIFFSTSKLIFFSVFFFFILISAFIFTIDTVSATTCEWNKSGLNCSWWPSWWNCKPWETGCAGDCVFTSSTYCDGRHLCLGQCECILSACAIGRGDVLSDCGTDSVGPWEYYCSNGDEHRKQLVTKRGCAVIGGKSQCYANSDWNSEFISPSCNTGTTPGPWIYYCSNGDEHRKRLVTVRGCLGTSCFVTSNWESEFISPSCNTGTTYGPWVYYCSGGDVYRKHLETTKGCLGISCFTNTVWADDNLWEDCDPGETCDPISGTCVAGDPPLSVSTNGPSLVEETTATLNGKLISDGGEACDLRFNWGDTASYGSNTGWLNNKHSGFSFSANLAGLDKGECYHFRANAKNSSDEKYGVDKKFITKPDNPSDLNAVAISSNQIDLSWHKGDGAYYTIVRRAEGGYPASVSDGYEAYYGTDSSFSDVVGLNPNTLYYYRAWSRAYEENIYAYSDGYAQTSATTKAGVGAPIVSTNEPSLVEEITATLNGTLDDDGGEACEYRFEYDEDQGEPYTYNTGWSGAGDKKTSGQSFTKDIVSLKKGTKYYFRAQSKNSAGIRSALEEKDFLTKPDVPTEFKAKTKY